LRMRVSISEIGSVIAMIVPPRLPRRFHHAGDFAFQRKLAEANTAQAKTAHVATRATANFAAIAHLVGELAARFTRNH